MLDRRGIAPPGWRRGCSLLSILVLWGGTSAVFAQQPQPSQSTGVVNDGAVPGSPVLPSLRTPVGTTDGPGGMVAGMGGPTPGVGAGPGPGGPDQPRAASVTSTSGEP